MKITLKDGKSFKCDENQTIYEAAKSNNITLEHSCLNARCRSCVVQVIEGQVKDRVEDCVISSEEKSKNITLSCNAVPLSDIVLDVQDLGNIPFYEKKILPAKIDHISKINNEIIEIRLRLPPSSDFKYTSGQYVNIINGKIKRSYSVANYFDGSGKLQFFIKKYEGGLMSDYFFHKAEVNDLLRIEGPLGTFFFRESTKENIIFLGTGTGIAPIKAILESLNKNTDKIINKYLWIFNGARYNDDFIWKPDNIGLENIKYISVTSREPNNNVHVNGYVQDTVLKKGINLSKSQVYACGSNEMIVAAREKLTSNGLEAHHFFADAFIQSN